MSTNLLSRVNGRSRGQSGATQNDELNCAFAGIATGITRPSSVRRPIDDANQGRKVLPLGVYPRVSEEVARSGGSWYFVTRPLFVQLARLRMIFGGTKLPMREALTLAKKEEADAALPEMQLAICVENPDATCLASYIKETREEIAAEERAVEVAEELLYARAGR